MDGRGGGCMWMRWGGKEWVEEGVIYVDEVEKEEGKRKREGVIEVDGVDLKEEMGGREEGVDE